MIEYWSYYHSKLINATLDHLQLVTISIILALVLAMAIIYVCINKAKWLDVLIYFFSALYAVPSYAFFALLIPLTGLGSTTAVIVLTLYSEYVLLRTFTTGIRQIDPLIVESARAMGMTDKQVFFRIQLPLAAKSIFSGIRLALTSIIGIATIAATINAGGLGTILFDGLRTQSVETMIWGASLTVLLCIFVNYVLKWIEKFALRNMALD
ncbi:ABC transporter permease [Aerococcus agrisoli]|uniref:ABC transporter permease n=1 Tax=Aerococcus agrisoli TaxID=2487350 RepID=A0A3N4GDX8_9LACT|nr:ABC transporter permease [Aerococcus agrisoli]RPA60989.1 ABC transporter permease [Aerococcus agrisoli]